MRQLFWVLLSEQHFAPLEASSEYCLAAVVQGPKLLKTSQEPESATRGNHRQRFAIWPFTSSHHAKGICESWTCSRL